MDSGVKFIPGLSPAGYAVALRKELKLIGRIEPFEIAKRLGVPVYNEDLDEIDGCLLKKADNKRILINKNILHLNRQRFTLAHELGHLQIKSHTEKMYRCSASDIQRYRGVKLIENEANDFASELLLPEADVQSIVRKRRLSMDLVKDISEDYGISLTATALKIIKVCPDRGAVVLSENGQIKWSFESKSFGYEVRKTKLHEYTYAYDYFNKSSLPDSPQRVLAYAWLGNARDRNQTLLEESIAIYSLGMVLTLIYTEDSEELEDEE